MHDTAIDPMAHASAEEPDVKALQEQYQRAWTQNPHWLADIARAEDIRYQRWPGQSEDGLKHQELLPEGHLARPYDRAPDCRVPLVDGTINELVDLEYGAFWAARVNIKPIHTTKLTAQQVAEWRAMISWIIHGPLKRNLSDLVEFAAQMTWTIGKTFLHPSWRAVNGLRMEYLTLEQILQFAMAAPEDSAFAQLPELIANEDYEETAVELFQQFYPHIKKTKARQVVRDLRSEGKAEFPVPEVVENSPALSVLIPGVDIIYPVETTEVQRGRAFFVRAFMSEADLLSMKNSPDPEERWDGGFVDACIKYTKGAVSDNSDIEQTRRDENAELIEVVHAYVRGVDDSGVAGVWCTVFSPHLNRKGATGYGEEPMYGKHYLLDYAHGEYPLILKQTEVVGRNPDDARGVSSVLATQQMQLKRQRDACAIFAEMNTTPPLLKKGTRASKLPPELGPLGIINVSTEGEWSKMDLAGEPKMALIIEEKVRAESKEYYGIPMIDAPLSAGQQRRQRFVNRSMIVWGEVLKQLSILTYQNLSPEELQEMLGKAPLLTVDMLKKQNLILWFDVRSMDNEWVKELIGQIIQLLQVDTGGVVDRAKLMTILLSYLDPTLADEVTTDQAGAAQAVFDKVRNDVMAIMDGNQPPLTQNDPTAAMKLQFVQQIIGSNMNYQLLLNERSPQFNPMLAKNMETYMQNLQHNHQEMVTSKMQGRLGVSNVGQSPIGQGSGVPAGR
jgi:hypothetical protein